LALGVRISRWCGDCGRVPFRVMFDRSAGREIPPISDEFSPSEHVISVQGSGVPRTHDGTRWLRLCSLHASRRR
jgi:hypothetical protein